MDLFSTIVVLIVFTALSMPVIVAGLVYFGKKKLEHKQIIAAIEKGVPVSELSIGRQANNMKQNKSDGPGWVQDQSKGITLLIIGIGIGVPFWFFIDSFDGGMFNVMWIIPVVFLGNGIGLLIRSRQRKKYEKPEPAQEEAAEQITL